MRKYNFDYNGFTFERITKIEARRHYSSGRPVMICAANLRPGPPFSPEIITNKFLSRADFEYLINEFEFYNCINSETGKRAAYYIPVVYIDPKTKEIDKTAFYYGRDRSKLIKQYDTNFEL